MSIKCTPYRLTTKAESLIQKAFALVQDFIINELDETYHLECLGLPQDKSKINTYHYLINYMAYVRGKVEDFLLGKQSLGEDPCLTDEELDKFKSVYLTDCIIDERVCDRYTNNIVELFIEDIPLCSEPFVYEWSGFGECEEIDNVTYRNRTTLLRKRGGFVYDSFLVLIGTTAQELAEQINVTEEEAQDILDDRLVEDVEGVCCLVNQPSIPVVTFSNVQSTQFDVSWVASESEVRLSLAQGSPDNVIQDIGAVTATNYTFTGLTASTTYYVVIEQENCAGRNISSFSVQTTPYIITINVCDDLQGQLVLTGAVEGNNLFETYEGTLSFRFEDPIEALYKVTSVLIDGVENIQNVVFDTIMQNIPTGGTIYVSGITSNVVVDICGEIGDVCSEITVTYDDILDTITIDYI